MKEHAKDRSRWSHVTCLIPDLYMHGNAGRAASYLSGRPLKLTGQTKTLVNGKRQCIVAHIQICK